MKRRTVVAPFLAALSLLAAASCAQPESVAGTTAEKEVATGNVDHAGIVEASTMMLSASPTNSILDGYNTEDPFNINSSAYSPTFGQRLASFDASDGNTDWTADQATAWVSRMSSGNYLVIDTSMPCDFDNPHTYLEIERAALTGQQYQTCGGRMPNEDALDVTLNFLIRGPAASVNDANALADGVNQATQPSANTFPYLADYNGI